MHFKQTLLAALLLTFVLSCSTLGFKGEEAEPTPPPPGDTIPETTLTEPSVDYSQFEKFTASKGEFTKKINLTWEAQEGADSYEIFRAVHKDKLYEKVADVKTLTWSDSDTTPGLKVYYRVLPITTSADEKTDESTATGKDETVVETKDEDPDKETLHLTAETEDKTSPDNFGFTKSIAPKGYSFARLTGSYTRGKPKMTKTQKDQETTGLKYLEKKIQHPVKLKMAMMMVQPYVTQKKLLALTNFKHYTLDRPNRMIYLFDAKHSYVVRLKSSYVSRNLFDNQHKVLFERLVYNSIAFAKSVGTTEVVDSEGVTRILPTFDAVALTTQYHPKSRNWRNETIFLVTGDKDLRREIQKAQNTRGR